MAITATRIALAGNPNSGKTTLFNALTGSRQYVGNWPGVTVEKKEGKIKGSSAILVDLPGIYSLSPYSPEEVVTRNYLLEQKPDAIINIVDSTNLERNLYLTLQLLEIGIPVIVALNMTDVIRKNGDEIDIQKLSEQLGCKVIEISALKETGLTALIASVGDVSQLSATPPIGIFSEPTEQALSEITLILSKHHAESLRFDAVKLFERDIQIMEHVRLQPAQQQEIEGIITARERAWGEDSESLIINERYTFIEGVVKACVRRKNTSMHTASDRIDRVLTNRYLALPIFAAIMFLVYYVSVTTVGAWATDWVNEALFPEIIVPAVEGWLESMQTAEWLNSLILDGIIGGVGAVLGFIPQLMVLFLFLAILEDCGYMARVAFIMDKVFRKFGLSGKSFIPLLIGTGCSVPGIMAARTIENEAERRMTIITTSFIPCGAKLPIIALIAGALFQSAWWVAPSAYFAGIAAVVMSGLILKKTKHFISVDTPFVMELPQYHMPEAKGVLRSMWDRGWAFVKKAGTVIFLSCGLIWFLSTFNASLEMVETGDSMLAAIGKSVAPLFAPLGFGSWEAAVAVFAGLIAKENVVGTLGILFGFAEIAEDGTEIWSLVAQSFTPLAAYSFLMFNLLCAPCFAAIGAVHREMGSPRWTLYALGYQTFLAYSISLMLNQFGLLLSGHGFTAFTAVAFVLLALFLYLIFRKPDHTSVSLKRKTPLTV